MCVVVVGVVLGVGAYALSPILLQLYSQDPEVISYGIIRMAIICIPYALCGMMDVMVGVLRGIGRSVMPMFVTLTGVCLVRVVWIYTIFKQIGTLESLYVSYPITWALTFVVHTICFCAIYFGTLRKRSL